MSSLEISRFLATTEDVQTIYESFVEISPFAITCHFDLKHAVKVLLYSGCFSGSIGKPAISQFGIPKTSKLLLVAASLAAQHCEPRSRKHDWLVRCHYNVTGWVSYQVSL